MCPVQHFVPYDTGKHVPYNTSSTPVVKSSLDFANVAKMLLQKTTVFHMSQIEIDDRIKVLKPWSEDPTPIPKIQKIHVIHLEFNGVTKLWKNAMETAPTLTIGATDDNEAVDNVGKGFTVGDWCVVNYEGARFPGEIVGIQNEEVQVSVMHKAGRYFKWPEKVDSIYYLPQNIEKRIQPPVVVGHRGQFSFIEFPSKDY